MARYVEYVNKRASPVNPKKCSKLKSSIYGAPGANHEWGMLFQSAHIETCGLTLSEVEPSLHVKIFVDEANCVVNWLICKIWIGSGNSTRSRSRKEF